MMQRPLWARYGGWHCVQCVRLKQVRQLGTAHSENKKDTKIQVQFNDRHSQLTQNICITFVQSWTNVEDIGPTLYKYYTNVLCYWVTARAGIHQRAVKHVEEVYAVHVKFISQHLSLFDMYIS